MKKLLIKFGNWLADRCDSISEWYAEGARQLRHCPMCGENVFYGRSCADVLGEQGKPVKPTLTVQGKW